MNIIFLDINYTIFSNNTFNNECIARINSIIETIPNTKIILLNDDNLFNNKDVIGSTNSITEWLSNNKVSLNIERFVVISANNSLIKQFPNNIVNCNKYQENEMFSERFMKESIWILTGYGKDKPMTQNIWFISDTHFFHENIIKYCDRPFSSIEEMNEILIKKWNSKIGNDDIVWHLGDFSFGKKENIEIVKRLNGRINLVMGNHDHQKIKFYYDAGFNRVYDRPVIINNFFILSHAPLEWVQNPMYNIFGHIHTNDLYKTWSKSGCCVCVERHDYSPVSWKEISKNIEALKK